MLRQIVESRFPISCLAAMTVWVAGWFQRPFPEDMVMPQPILLGSSAVFYAARFTFIAMWFTTPWMATTMLLSLAYIFLLKHENQLCHGHLLPYPDPAACTRLSIFAGEIHHPEKPVAAANRNWLTVPERGLYTGIVMVGAIGADLKRERCFHQVLFFCDECHSFATVGENDPTGEEKSLSQSRLAHCIRMVATKSIRFLRSTLPGESWNTILRTFRTKIFRSLLDDFSTRLASDLCGKEEQLKGHYSISENDIDVGINVRSSKSGTELGRVHAQPRRNRSRHFRGLE